MSGPSTSLDDLFFVAWAAGFFDGEGCIYAGREAIGAKYPTYRFVVTIVQVDRRPLAAMHDRWGGRLSFRPRAQDHHKDQWCWQLRGEDAALYIAEILPFLRVKDVVARAALPVLHRTHRHGVRFKPHEIAEREEALRVIRAANQRGRRRAA